MASADNEGVKRASAKESNTYKQGTSGVKSPAYTYGKSNPRMGGGINRATKGK